MRRLLAVRSMKQATSSQVQLQISSRGRGPHSTDTTGPRASRASDQARSAEDLTAALTEHYYGGLIF
jgi:hypothetical protein